MKKNRKYLLAAIALMFVFAIGATIAYLTDTEETKNTFVLGNVDITLTEPTWTSTGAAKAAAGILPGAVIEKDPTIQNTGTTSAYVFVEIEEPCYGTTKLFTLKDASGNTGVNTGWSVVGTAGSCTGSGYSTVKTVYAWGSTSAMTELTVNSTTTTPLFTTVKYDEGNALTPAAIEAINTALGTGENDAQKPAEIVVKGYGIQKDNLGTTTPSAVWALFNH